MDNKTPKKCSDCKWAQRLCGHPGMEPNYTIIQRAYGKCGSGGKLFEKK